MALALVNCYLSDKRKDEKDISGTPWKTTPSIDIFMSILYFAPPSGKVPSEGRPSPDCAICLSADQGQLHKL